MSGPFWLVVKPYRCGRPTLAPTLSSMHAMQDRPFGVQQCGLLLCSEAQGLLGYAEQQGW